MMDGLFALTMKRCVDASHARLVYRLEAKTTALPLRWIAVAATSSQR